MGKKTLSIAILCSLLAITSCRPLIKNYMQGKRERQLAGGGAGDAFAPYYDTKTVTTINGKVTKVENFIATSMRVKAVRAFVQTTDKEVEVHLGPIWYIAKQPFKLKPGNIITVTGSMIEGKIMVQKFILNNERFVLRDEAGQPKWFRSMDAGAPMGRH